MTLPVQAGRVDLHTLSKESTVSEGYTELYHPKGPVTVHIDGGHCCIVETTPAPVLNRFLRAALAMGCLQPGSEIAMDADVDAEPDGQGQGVHEILVETIKAMLSDTGNDDEFTGSGFPKEKAITKRTGITASRVAISKAWKQVMAEAEDAVE